MSLRECKCLVFLKGSRFCSSFLASVLESSAYGQYAVRLTGFEVDFGDSVGVCHYESKGVRLDYRRALAIGVVLDGLALPAENSYRDSCHGCRIFLVGVYLDCNTLSGGRIAECCRQVAAHGFIPCSVLTEFGVVGCDAFAEEFASVFKGFGSRNLYFVDGSEVRKSVLPVFLNDFPGGKFCIARV